MRFICKKEKKLKLEMPKNASRSRDFYTVFLAELIAGFHSFMSRSAFFTFFTCR